MVEAPAEAGPAPRLQWQSGARLASVVATESDLLATMNALHTLCRTGCDAAVIAPAATVSDTIDVARDENAVQVEDDKDGGIHIRAQASASHLDLHSVFYDVIASAAPWCS